MPTNYRQYRSSAQVLLFRRPPEAVETGRLSLFEKEELK